MRMPYIRDFSLETLPIVLSPSICIRLAFLRRAYILHFALLVVRCRSRQPPSTVIHRVDESIPSQIANHFFWIQHRFINYSEYAVKTSGCHRKKKTTEEEEERSESANGRARRRERFQRIDTNSRGTGTRIRHKRVGTAANEKRRYKTTTTTA